MMGQLNLGRILSKHASKLGSPGSSKTLSAMLATARTRLTTSLRALASLVTFAPANHAHSFQVSWHEETALQWTRQGIQWSATTTPNRAARNADESHLGNVT